MTRGEAVLVSLSPDKQCHRRGRNEPVCDTGSNRPAICSSLLFPLQNLPISRRRGLRMLTHPFREIRGKGF